MEISQLPVWIQIFSVATNFSILIVGLKLVRHLSRLEFKVDMMWGTYMRKFGSRGHDRDLLADEDTE